MTVNNIASNRMAESMMRVSAGNRINSAKDDAAGLAIANKMTAIIEGLDKGTQNTQDMQNLVKTAEGGLSTISDSLQRIRELGVQASNGIYSDSDRQIMQMEINQMLDHVNTTAKGTEFNNMKLLDGSFNGHTASYADGSGANIKIGNMGGNTLGISGFDVTGGAGTFDLSVIDNAISTVNSQRAELGAKENRFEYTINSNNITNLNLAAAKSRIADADMAKEMMKVNAAKTIQSYQFQMQKNSQENVGVLMSLLA